VTSGGADAVIVRNDAVYGRPSLIIHNARIYTGAAEGDVVDALAVAGDRIAAVGRAADVLALATNSSAVVDLGGRTVLPGLIDSHNHLLEVGIKAAAIRLDECRSPAEMAALVRQRAAVTPPGRWIVGMGWNEANFPGQQLPTVADIDAATDRHPVLLMRFFNTDLVNTVALRQAGITSGTPHPPGGRIEHDAKGEPNGLLRATAKTLVRQLVPAPTTSELRAALQLGYQETLRLGITSVIEPGLYPSEMRAYQESYRHDELAVRVNLMPNWHGFRDDESPAQLDARAAELGVGTGLGDEWLRLGALKMAIDGGTTPRNAYMYAPFEGDDELRPFLRLPLDELRGYLDRAQELGWDVGIHCCGDRAQDVAVQAIVEAVTARPRLDARHSIIHAYFPSDTAIRAMATHRIAAVIQPTFLYWEGNQIFRDVGEGRAGNYKPIRRYLDAGVPVAASSDVTSTVTADPFVSMYALVTRLNCEGTAVAPGEAISRWEALQAYTTAGAWLTHEEHIKGTLTPGRLADFIVIDRDFFAVPVDAIRETTVLATVVGGRLVHGSLL
jgi:hypothetical protein